MHKSTSGGKTETHTTRSKAKKVHYGGGVMEALKSSAPCSQAKSNTKKRNKILSPLGLKYSATRVKTNSRFTNNARSRFTDAHVGLNSYTRNVRQSCPICGVEYAKTHHETKIINKIVWDTRSDLDNDNTQTLRQSKC